MAHLLYGVGAGGGFILLTGEVGTGKTTLNRCLIEQLPDSADVAIVLNPALDSRDLLATVCDELQIALPAQEPRPGLKVLTDLLHRFLLDNHARGRKTVLIIDEAQHLDFEVLEQIRLLTNLETHDEKLLHIILIGQPELAEKLARPELRQLNQRITARYDLQPLTLEETGAYIRHRLQVAGRAAGGELFSAGLVRQIHRHSGGVPRLVNLLCDRMLLGAYGQGSDRLDRGLLRRAAREVLGSQQASRSVPLPVLGTLAALAVAAALGALVYGEVPPAAPVAPAPVASERPVPAPAPADDATVAADNWQLQPARGAQLLGALYGVDVRAADPCRGTAGGALRCERGAAETWDALLALNRPLLLELRDARRFAARALFVGIENDDALLVDGGGVQRVPLTELAAAWTGGFLFYWRVPEGWSGAVAEGDRGASVAIIAQLFAALDGQPRPLAGDVYSAPLAQRVRLFQGAAGLQADGVAGEQTLRALVLAAGTDIDRQRAREIVAARVAAGQWP